jgi:hypothetical protein
MIHVKSWLRHVEASRDDEKGALIAVIEESLVINRPRRDIFDFIVTPENMSLWISNIIEYERITEGPQRKTR